MGSENNRDISRLEGGTKGIPNPEGTDVQPPEPIILSKHVILQRMKAIINYDSFSLEDIASRNKEMYILSKCLDAPGQCSYDTKTGKYILPGDDILKRDTTDEKLSNRDILIVLWRLNLEINLTDDLEKRLELTDRLYGFSLKLR